MISRHRTDFWIKSNSIDVSVKDLRGNVEIHWHEFYEIELILDGAGIYNVDGIDYEIKPGALFFMSPSSVHHINFTKNTRLINFMFTSQVCELDFLCGLFSLFPHIYLNLVSKDVNFIHMIASEMVNTGYDKYLSAQLNCVLGKIKSIYPENTSGVKETNMQYALLYIQNHFKEKIRLEDVAAAANYTPNYFSNKFKEYTGVTFKRYIMDMQFSMAVNMLEKTELSVTEVCYNCGFRDFPNFMVCFRKRYGVTPKKYREKIKMNAHP